MLGVIKDVTSASTRGSIIAHRVLRTIITSSQRVIITVLVVLVGVKLKMNLAQYIEHKENNCKPRNINIHLLSPKK